MSSSDRTSTARRRRWGQVAAVSLLTALIGALVGVVVAFVTPAHVEIVGSDTRIWLQPGHAVDQFGVTGVVTLKRPTTRAVLGEPLGVHAVLELDTSVFLTKAGKINTDVLPAYIQAYSDPHQLVGDIQHALLMHLLWCALGWAGAALLLVGARRGYRRWRASYDRAHFPDGRARSATRAYRAPERTWLRRAAGAVVFTLLLAAIPSGRWHPPSPGQVQANPILADTPLAGVEVDGLLRPALVAARDYIRTYFGQTDKYYSALREKLLARLATAAPALPGGEHITQLGFVTDRHCNTGMDRVIVALMEHFGVTTLVSAGDDAFSGTFSFESACTRGLAQQTRKAGIEVVVAAGNHDSAQTIADEKAQGMTTLTGPVESVNGMRFIGSPDPRSSRYGAGIQPSSERAQHAVTDEQGRQVGAKACSAQPPVIAVLHDPRAGAQALRHGCGKVTVALDGHTHEQAGPVDVPLPDGSVGQAFTGGSAGGAPGQGAVDRTFASRLTVGPLNHDAFANIVSFDRAAGRIVAVTTFGFTPDQNIEVTQQNPG